MSGKVLKTKEERLLELYIQACISETEFYKMLRRIKEEVK